MAEGARPVRARRVGFEKDRGVLEVQTEAGFAFCRVLPDAQPGCDAALEVLRPLAERQVCVRFVKIHPGCVSFVAPEERLSAVQEALALSGAPLELSVGCAAVTVVAPGVRSIPGLLARVGEALHARAIEVYQTADSHSSVSCVIPGDRAAEAVEALRGEFGLPDGAP